MRVATYVQGKGKNRARYRCEVKSVDGGSMTLLSRLLGRIGVRIGTVLSTLDGGFMAIAFTSFGERVFAPFGAGEARLARLFVYRVSRLDSPQLSLWGVFL